MLQLQQSNTQRHYGGNSDLFSAPIQKVKIPEESVKVYARIKSNPGGIKQADLCKHFKVGKTRMNQSLRDLMKFGLIETRVGAKYTVTEKRHAIEPIDLNRDRTKEHLKDVKRDVVRLLSNERLLLGEIWLKCSAISNSRFTHLIERMYLSKEIGRDANGLYFLLTNNTEEPTQQSSVVQQVATTEMVHQAPTQQESAQKEPSATLRLAKAIAANSLLEKERQKKLLTEIECLKAQVLQLNQDAAQIKAFFHKLINAMTS